MRILIAKPGLDGHDRGAKVVALVLRQAGFEIIYTGLHQTIESIVEAAVQEDVDVIGLSVLSGAHLPIARKLISLLNHAGVDDRLILFGGHIPARDIPALEAMGVNKVFPTGSTLEEIVGYLQARVSQPEAISQKRAGTTHE